MKVRLITRDGAEKNITFSDEWVGPRRDLVLPLVPVPENLSAMAPIRDDTVILQDGELVDGIKFQHRRYRFCRYETIAFYTEI